MTNQTTAERFLGFLNNVVFVDQDQISEGEFMALAEEYNWPRVWAAQPKMLAGTHTVIAMALESGHLRWKDHGARILERQTLETWSKYGVTQAQLDAQYDAEVARQRRANPSWADRIEAIEKLAGTR